MGKRITNLQKCLIYAISLILGSFLTVFWVTDVKATPVTINYRGTLLIWGVPSVQVQFPLQTGSTFSGVIRYDTSSTPYWSWGDSAYYTLAEHSMDFYDSSSNMLYSFSATNPQMRVTDNLWGTADSVYFDGYSLPVNTIFNANISELNNDAINMYVTTTDMFIPNIGNTLDSTEPPSKIEMENLFNAEMFMRFHAGDWSQVFTSTGSYYAYELDIWGNITDWTVTEETASSTVPEPATIVLLGSAGLMGLFFRKKLKVEVSYDVPESGIHRERT